MIEYSGNHSKNLSFRSACSKKIKEINFKKVNLLK